MALRKKSEINGDQMKKVLIWGLRIICIVIIAVAGYTLIDSMLHINDDHSINAILGDDAYTPMLEHVESDPEAVEETPEAVQVEPSALEALEVISVMPEHDETLEEPSVALTPEGVATANHPVVTVTAAFGDIIHNITADLNWYLDGELVLEEKAKILVEGSTASCDMAVDVEAEGADTAEVVLEVLFADKSYSVEASFPVQRVEAETVIIQTAEIPVTALETATTYLDEDLSEKAGEMEEGETGLLLEYSTNEDGVKVLRLQMSDGEKLWVSAKKMEISEDSHIAEEDYTEEAKVEFVNSMGYDSPTEMLVWVSLYTQKVNVFTGYAGHWELEKSFDCSSGKNTSPTTTGVYYYYDLVSMWDLGDTYCEPVLVYNGGEAFTSQPYDDETDEVADDTMGEPASGGAIRMEKDDIEWMEENLQMNTMIVVY